MRRVGEYPLWIGTARDARDLRAVLDAGIEAIVDLAMDEPPVQPTRELVYLRFPLVDGGGNPPWLLSTTVWGVAGLLRAKCPTLVACSAGMSRSVAIAAAAIMGAGLSPGHGSGDEALDLVRGSGPGDLHPQLWDEVKRHGMTLKKIRYEPRGD
jgi:protein-tyrosine phosphatase